MKLYKDDFKTLENSVKYANEFIEYFKKTDEFDPWQFLFPENMSKNSKIYFEIVDFLIDLENLLHRHKDKMKKLL